MKKILKRLCMGFLAFTTIITTLSSTVVHAESKQYWTQSNECVGIVEKVMNDLLSSCKNQGISDINVVIQSYNYGGGYVGYVAENGEKHTFNLAENFAREKSGGKKVTYTNPIAVAKNGGWRYAYGNMFYCELVNQYLNVTQFNNATVQAIMNEAFKRIIKYRKKSEKFIVDGYSDFLFLNRNGLPKVAGNYAGMLKGLVKKYNKTHEEQLPHITPHTFRHTFCTNMANKGMNPNTLQYVMGHASIIMTLNYYAHGSYTSARAEMDRLCA